MFSILVRIYSETIFSQSEAYIRISVDSTTSALKTCFFKRGHATSETKI